MTIKNSKIQSIAQSNLMSGIFYNKYLLSNFNMMVSICKLTYFQSSVIFINEHL